MAQRAQYTTQSQKPDQDGHGQGAANPTDPDGMTKTPKCQFHLSITSLHRPPPPNLFYFYCGFVGTSGDFFFLIQLGFIFSLLL
jgi:hypothetical protein